MRLLRFFLPLVVDFLPFSRKTQAPYQNDFYDIRIKNPQKVIQTYIIQLIIKDDEIMYKTNGMVPVCCNISKGLLATS